MNSAAPLLLRHTPSSLPIREPISTIVWVCRGWWRSWHHWWQDWLDWWQRWWCSGSAPTMMDPATPSLLISCPGVFCIHGAIEWVHWPRRYRTCGCRCVGWCRRWRGRWCGRWRGEGSWRNCHRWLRQSCSGPCRRAPPAHSAAAEILLCLGPRCLPHRESSVTIVRECACSSRQQPGQQREQQQQTQQTTARDDASEISSWSNCVEVASCADIFVSCFLDILSLASSHV